MIDSMEIKTNAIPKQNYFRIITREREYERAAETLLIKQKLERKKKGYSR